VILFFVLGASVTVTSLPQLQRKYVSRSKGVHDEFEKFCISCIKAALAALVMANSPCSTAAA
jgi:hypothetical protein